MGLRERLADAIAPARKKVSEVIGRSVGAMGAMFDSMTGTSVDATKSDYKFWDSFRYGKAKGFEFGSLFAKPIVEIISGTMLGSGLNAQLIQSDDVSEEVGNYTNGKIRQFLRRNLAMLMQMVKDLFSLGDQYVVVNLDGSLSVPSPDQVRLEYDPLDYRKMVKATIRTKLTDADITDEYTAETRILRIKWNDTTKGENVETYSNVLGRIPIVHLANERSANETNGRPIYEAMFYLLERFNRLLTKALSGAEMLSNPVPVLEGLEDVDEAVELNGEEVTDESGNKKWVINFAKLKILLLGKGGSFKFASPGAGFTDDIRNMLKSLFLLILDFTRIPEVIWGNELSSSRATSGDQMSAFYQHIEARRIAIEGEGADEEMLFEPRGGILAIIDLWLSVKALTDRQIIRAPVEMLWSELSQRDEAQLFAWTQWADGRGYITPQTALAQAGFSGVDPEAEIEAVGVDGVDPFTADTNNQDELMADLEAA